MPSSTYRPLTGREIREAIKLRLIQEVDKLPHLREGNSFHNVNVQLAIVITAYPDDVPTPNLDINFDLPSKGYEDLEIAVRQINKAEELVTKYEEAERMIEGLKGLMHEIVEKRNTLVFEHESEQEFNGNIPDKTRVEHGLSVTVEKVEKGRKNEVKVEAAEFKKLAKL